MNNYSSLSEQEKRMIQSELENDEEILWADKPNLEKFARKDRKNYIYAFLWILIWITIVAYILYNNSDQSNLGVYFNIISLFIIVLILNPLFTRLKAKQTVYVVTNQRAVIIRIGMINEVFSFKKEKLNAMEKSIHKDGYGDIVFETISTYNFDGDREDEKIGFFAIEDINYVEELIIREIIKKDC